MPSYPTVTYAPYPKSAVSGRPEYFFGSIADAQDTFMVIDHVAIATNVATLNVTITQGNIPLVGQRVNVQGVSTASGAFNLTAVLTGVTITAATGVGTITYALTHADVGSTAATGEAVVPVQEVAEALANGDSIPVYSPAQEPRDYGAKSITTAVTFPSIPTAATVDLYTALNYQQGVSPAPGATGSEWTKVATVATVAGSAQSTATVITSTAPAGRWYCLHVSGVSGGTNPTILAKVIF